MNGTITASNGDTTFTYDPTQDFFPGELVQVSASRQILDSGGTSITPYVWQFRTAVSGGSGDFGLTAHDNFGAGDSFAVALGDVDGDGDPDAVIANYANQPQEVWLNDGAGDFGIAAYDSFGAGDSRSVALGDVDGDGDLDAVIANTNGQAQEVWLNDGVGDFGAAAYASFGAGDSQAVTLGDVDGDGNLDAVIANTNSQAQEVWLNDGAGGFGVAAYDSFGAGDSYWTALGDLDGDGDLDAVIANIGGQAQEVWLNNGSGGFGAAAHDSFGAGDSYSVALGDVDGDGDLDAVIANYSGQAQEVWLNDGGGGFGVAAYDSFGAGDSYSVALGDLDGDSDLDAVIANSGGTQPQEVWLNDGQGGFDAATPAGFGTGYGVSVALGDLDGDGDLDAVIANIGGQAQESWLNQNQVDLSIQTTAEPYIAAPGNPLTFTLDYKNNGPNLATQVVITDAIPANVIDTTVSSSGAAITQIGTAPNYAWSVADLSPGQGGTIIIQGFIASPQAAGTFLNIASIATVVSDTNIANNTSSATVVVPNVPPQVTAEFYAAQQNTTLDVAAPGVLNNDSDPNGDPVFAGLLNTPSVGTLNLNANGAFTYNPATDQVGTVTFDYVAYDGPLAEQNLLGLWKFDEGSGTNAADASGNGNAGTLLNGPTWLTATPAVQFADPYAISFDGIDDYLQLPPNFPNTDDFSFAAWIYWRGGGAWQRIFDFGPDTQYNMFLTPRSDAGTLRFAITTNFKGGEQLLNAPSALPENQWVHVALTLEGDTGKLWIDGVMQDTQTITLNPSDIVSRPNSNTWLGKSNYSDPYLNGSLDEVRIYGRALSEIEIATLASGQPSTAGLNDTATASIVVQPAVPQADLHLKDLRLVPNQVCRGQQFAVIFEHSNLGNLAVGAHTVTFFNESSPNSFINPIGSAPIPSAAPWQDQHFGFNTNSYLTGTRYLTLYADFDNLISEFDEANNFKTIPITVTLDPAPPGMLLINGGADLTNDPTLTLSLQAVDSGACATSVAAMRFAYGGNLTPWEPYTTTKTLTLSADGPNLRVEVQFRDQHGNASPFI
ncbi:MAG TPA: hypothetical protein DEH22_05805, partial [Chloroflexi bacterium]|nr:hypothetical protein [Chloroflexota bacterium]